MTSTAEIVTTVCPRQPEGVHNWSLFPGGMGCLYCPAWKSMRSGRVLEESAPSRYPALRADETAALRYGLPVAATGFDYSKWIAETAEREVTDVLLEAAALGDAIRLHDIDRLGQLVVTKVLHARVVATEAAAS